MPRLLPALAVISLLLSSNCGLQRRLAGDSFKAGVSPRFGMTESQRFIETKVDENGAVVGRVNAGSNDTQILSAQGALQGASISFPPGSIAVDMDITLAEGLSLSDDGSLAELGLNNKTGVSAVGAALLVSTSASVNPAVPFQVALPLPKTGLTLDVSQYFVVYRVIDYATGKLLVGVIGSDQLRLDNGNVTFPASFFGAYQVFSSPVAVSAKVQATETSPTVKKNTDGQTGAGDSGTGDSGADGEELPAFALHAASFADGATGMSLRPTLTFTMTNDLNTTSASATGSTTFTDDATGAAVPHTRLVQGGDNRTLEVTPTQDLALRRTYSLQVDSGIKDTKGQTLGTPIIQHFTTRDGALGSYMPLTTAASIGANGYDPVVAGNADGKIVVAVRNSDDEIVARYYDGTTWSSPVTVAVAAGTLNPKVAVSPGGAAVIAWIDGTSLYAARTTDGGSTWTSPSNFMQSAAVRDFGLKVAATGRFYLAWFERSVALATAGATSDVTYLYTSYFDGPSWSTPVSPWSNGSGVKYDFDKGMAVSSSNHVAVTWWLESGYIFVYHSNGGTTFHQVNTTAYTSLSNPPQIAMHSGGNAVVIWEEQPGTNPVLYNKYSVGSNSWETNEAQLTAAGRFPDLAMAGPDEAVAAWVNNSTGHVSAARFNFIDRAWRGTEILATSLSGLDSGLKVIAGAGGASVIWYYYDSGVPSYRGMMASYRPINGTYAWSTAANVTTGGGYTYDASGVGYAGIDAAGNASYFGYGPSMSYDSAYAFAAGNGGYTFPIATFAMSGFTAVLPRGMLVLPSGVTALLLRAEQSGNAEMGIRLIE